jgi:hypothetical protein
VLQRNQSIDPFGKIWKYFVMPTKVNTFRKCCDEPDVDTFCPEFEASISIWIISAIPLELMYSTFEKSSSTSLTVTFGHD